MNPPRHNRFQNYQRQNFAQEKGAAFSTNKSGGDSNPTLFPVRTSGVALHPEELLAKVPVGLASPSSKPQPSVATTPSPAQKTEPMVIPHEQRASKHPQKTKSSVVKLKPATPTRQSSTVVPFPERIEQSHRRQRHRSSNQLTSLGLTILRLLILGVGLGAIAGTVLARVDSKHSRIMGILPEVSQSLVPVKSQLMGVKSALTLEQEIMPLKEKLTTLVAPYPQLQPGAFFVDLDNGNYVDFGGEVPFSAASTIKIPVLVAFLQAVDAGEIQLDEALTLTPELVAGGSGDMQYQEPGKQFSALETATKMITISDNTATNMIIERLGGAEVLNQQFQDWGLKDTVINSPLPDLEGTNITSPKDLAQVMALVEKGELISLRSRDRFLQIMGGTVTNTLLPQGLEAGATIAHKTGDIGSVLGDAGIIDMPSGKRYLATVMVKRPHNDPQAKPLIQEISKTVYQHLKWSQPSPFTEDAFTETVESSE